MEVKKIVEGMTASQVAQVIDDNFKGLNEEKANKVETDAKLAELGSELGMLITTEKEDIIDQDTKVFLNNLSIHKGDVVVLRINGDFSGLVFVHESSYRLVPEAIANETYKVVVDRDVNSLSIANFSGKAISVSLSYSLKENLREIVNNKVDKVEGKNLSQNDFTNEDLQVVTSIGSALKKGKNKLNTIADGVEIGRGLYGDDWFVGEFNTSDFIECEPNKDYVCSNDGDESTARWITFFDENKNVIKYIQSAYTFKTPENAFYFRAAIATNMWDKFQIEEGTSQTEYVMYGSVIDGKHIEEKTINSNALKDSKVGANLININDAEVKMGVFIAGSTTQASESFNTTAFIKVQQGKRYIFSCNGQYAAMRFVTFYDEGKNVLSYLNNIREIEIDNNACYIRISIHTRWWKFAQLNEGYVLPYTPFEASVVSAETKKQGFMGEVYEVYDAISSGSSVTFFTNHLAKNYTLSVLMEGSVSSVILGVGSFEKADYKAKLTSTLVEVYSDESGTYGKVASFEHGLNLGVRTYFQINVKDDGMANIVVCSEGNQFTVNTQWRGRGAAYFLNSGDSLKCKFSLMPNDLIKPTWVFGDSYYSHDAINRHPYYLYQEGYKDWLLNNKGGINSSSSLVDLKNLINLGYAPKYIVWGLGMNDSIDANEDTPDAEWLRCVSEVIELCESIGITPILCTIPNALGQNLNPIINYYHGGKSKWVRNSGYRYIDYALAVGSNEDGLWYDGCKGLDIHPTDKGAKMLAQQVMIDFPEIMVKP